MAPHAPVSRPRLRRFLAAMVTLAVLPSMTTTVDANTYAGRLRSIAVPRFNGIKSMIDQDSDPAVPANAGSSSNFWIGLNGPFPTATATPTPTPTPTRTDATPTPTGVTPTPTPTATAPPPICNLSWVQIGWSRERMSATDATLVKRAYVEWCDPTLANNARHHLVFYPLPAGLLADYSIEQTGKVWVWTAGGNVLENTKPDGAWARSLCTAGGQAEMIPNSNNVNCVGSTVNPSCIRLLNTRVNAGAFTADNLGPNVIRADATGNVNIGNGISPNSFCVWDTRN